MKSRLIQTHDQIVEAEEIRVDGMDGLLGLPVRVQDRLDVIGGHLVDGEVVGQRPRVERLFLGLGRRHISHPKFHFPLKIK